MKMWSRTCRVTFTAGHHVCSFCGLANEISNVCRSFSLLIICTHYISLCRVWVPGCLVTNLHTQLYLLTSPRYPPLRLAADYARSGSSLSTEYGSWQIVSGCGSIHDHAHFPPPLASASSTSSAVAAAYDSPLPFSFQDEGPSGRM